MLIKLIFFRSKQVALWLSLKVQKGDCRIVFTESRYEA